MGLNVGLAYWHWHDHFGLYQVVMTTRLTRGCLWQISPNKFNFLHKKFDERYEADAAVQVALRLRLWAKFSHQY